MMKYIMTLTMALAGMMAFASPVNAELLTRAFATIPIKLSLHKMRKDASAAIVECAFQLTEPGKSIFKKKVSIPAGGELETQINLTINISAYPSEFPVKYKCTLMIVGPKGFYYSQPVVLSISDQSSPVDLYARAKKGVFFKDEVTGTIPK